MFKYLALVFVCVAILRHSINKGRIYESKRHEGKKRGRKKGNVVAISLHKLVPGVEKVSWMPGSLTNPKVSTGLSPFLSVRLHNGETFSNYEHHF